MSEYEVIDNTNIRQFESEDDNTFEVIGDVKVREFTGGSSSGGSEYPKYLARVTDGSLNNVVSSSAWVDEGFSVAIPAKVMVYAEACIQWATINGNGTRGCRFVWGDGSSAGIMGTCQIEPNSSYPTYCHCNFIIPPSENTRTLKLQYFQTSGTNLSGLVRINVVALG